MFLLEALAVFILSVAILLVLNSYYSSSVSEEVYIGISSESLVQTLPATVLKDKPFSGLYFNHIHPPMFDGIRASIAYFWKLDRGLSLRDFVDKGVYHVYTVLFGALGVLLFIWLKKATGSRLFSWIGTILWLVHPAPLSMAAFLDGTFLSSILITWMVFEVWLIGRKEQSISRLILVAILCFFTRAHFQWFFVPVLGVAMLLMSTKANKKSLLYGLCIFSLVVGMYCIKQYMLFGTVNSYGWYGEKLAGLLWIEEVGEVVSKGYKENCGGREIVRDRIGCKQYLGQIFPDELMQVDRLYPQGALSVSGGSNTEDRWWLTQVQSRIAKDYCSKNVWVCAESFSKSLLQNFPEYWVESWDRNNPLLSRDNGIPWVNIYYKIVHNYPWILFCSAIIFVIIILRRWQTASKVRILGVCVVPSYVLGITLLGNNYDAFEGGRLKFLLEPTIYVFILVHIYLAIKFIYIGASPQSTSFGNSKPAPK